MSDEKLSIINTVITTTMFNDFLDSIKSHIDVQDVARYKNLASLRNLDVIEFFAKKYDSSGIPGTLLLESLDQVLNTRKTLINLLQ